MVTIASLPAQSITWPRRSPGRMVRGPAAGAAGPPTPGPRGQQAGVRVTVLAVVSKANVPVAGALFRNAAVTMTATLAG
jgi:hypothetical protein